jgi:hypothetical protein
MQKINLEYCVPLDLGEWNLVGIGRIQNLAVEAARSQLLDPGDFQLEQAGKPVQQLMARGEISAVYHGR